MQILVTGAAGFIGFHLCNRLIDEGHDVIAIDNFISGQRRNADDLRELPRLQFIEHDIGQQLPTLPALQQIYNLACPASPVDFETKSLEIMDVCSNGIRNLITLAIEHNARLLQTSTSEVYGDPKVHPQTETYWGNVNPIGPRACYDEGKRFAEAMLTSARRTLGLQLRIARIFNTYGPRMRPDDGRALPNFITQALANQAITLHGDGSQTRSFCFVSDQVDGLIRLMNSDVLDPVNIGNPVEVTIREVAEEIVRFAKSSSPIECVPRPKDDPAVRKPDISRANELLQWNPQVTREVGFPQTIDWFRALGA